MCAELAQRNGSDKKLVSDLRVLGGTWNEAEDRQRAWLGLTLEMQQPDHPEW